MSILSCERFRSDQHWVDIVSKNNTVEVNLEEIPYTDTATTNKITISNGTGHTALNVNGDIRVQHVRDPIYYAGTNSVDSFKTIGYRFFFQSGFLKCVKKEASHYSIINAINTATVSLHGSTRNRRESFYHPAAVWDSVRDANVRKQIQNHVSALALRRGVQVPPQFHQDGEQYNGVQKGYFFAALDWMAYPIIREINSPTVCKNLTNDVRRLICPTFEPMNFKQLVEHYYGNSTSKMIQELWKVVTVGGDFKQTRFATEPTRDAFLVFHNQPDILEDRTEYVVQIGNRHINTLVFNVGAAIFKTMGFDYFYQAAPKLGGEGNQPKIGFMDGESRVTQIEFNLTTLLTRVSPKKLIKALLEDQKGLNFHDLHDTASMLREYDTFEKIPKTLRLQYPTGLSVDFKFKTVKELHDKISVQYTIIKTEASRREIPVALPYRMLHGMEDKGLAFHVPDNTSTLAIWGKLLNICVASYGDRAVKGDTLLLGVEKEGLIKYCIEFRSLIVPRLAHGPIVGLCKEGSLPEITQAPEYIREAYPRLKEQHVGVMPTDVPDEEGVYYIPSIVQFRSDRNGAPDPEDKIVVENMLVRWVQLNFELLKDIKGIFDEQQKGYDVGGALNIDMINDAVNRAAFDQGQPNQLMMNPRDLAAYQRAFNPAERMIHIDDNGRMPLVFGNGINVIADPNIEPGQVIVHRNVVVPQALNHIDFNINID